MSNALQLFIKGFHDQQKIFISLTILYMQTNTSKWKKKNSEKYFTSKQIKH